MVKLGTSQSDCRMKPCGCTTTTGTANKFISQEIVGLLETHSVSYVSVTQWYRLGGKRKRGRGREKKREKRKREREWEREPQSDWAASKNMWLGDCSHMHCGCPVLQSAPTASI